MKRAVVLLAALVPFPALAQPPASMSVSCFNALYSRAQQGRPLDPLSRDHQQALNMSPVASQAVPTLLIERSLSSRYRISIYAASGRILFEVEGMTEQTVYALDRQGNLVGMTYATEYGRGNRDINDASNRSVFVSAMGHIQTLAQRQGICPS